MNKFSRLAAFTIPVMSLALSSFTLTADDEVGIEYASINQVEELNSATQQAPRIALNQGDSIYFSKNNDNVFNVCTVAYIGHKIALTAAHCGNVGSTVINESGETIGILSAVNNNTDVGEIALRDNVRGVNGFSGNTIVPKENIQPTDVICQYGQTTKQVMCGKQVEINIRDFIWSQSKGQKGDSGGAAWINGKGFIGVISQRIATDETDPHYHSTGITVNVPRI